MAKYYVCEAHNANQGVDKVTPFEDAELALLAASNSQAQVHFVSTINPLEAEPLEAE